MSSHTMTKALVLCFFGFVYTNSGLSTENIRPANATNVTVDDYDLAIARVRERSNEETKYAAIAAAQAVAETARISMAATLEEMHKTEASEREKRQTSLKQMIDAAFARKLGLNLLKRKSADNVTKSEAAAIQRVQERTQEELVYKAIAAALALAENARIAAVAELEKLHEHEKETRKTTDAVLKAALDLAVANQR